MKKYENFCNALNNLKEIYEYNEPYNNVELTGLVGLFEVCFEQSWKAMKEILYANGFSEGQTGSPRQILKTAYEARMIKNDIVWLEALRARNNVAHAYNKDVALDIIQETKNNYYNLFVDLKETLEKNWLSKRKDKSCQNYILRDMDKLYGMSREKSVVQQI